MMDKETKIKSFAAGDIQSWNGIPENFREDDLIELFGTVVETTNAELGYYPAKRILLADATGLRKLVAFLRDGVVILVESLVMPDAAVLEQLPVPDAVLPPEMLLPGAHPNEYIYCNRGLNLTVAKYADERIPDRIVRCRGVRQLGSSREFDARYYRAFEDQIVYSGGI